MAKISVEMAESATEIPISIEESVIETVKNVTDKPPSSIEGIAIAYLSLVIMASLPIFFGSFRSVKYLKEQKVSISTMSIHTSVLPVQIHDVQIHSSKPNRISARCISVAYLLRVRVNNCIQRT